MKKLSSALDTWASRPTGIVGVSAARCLLGFVGLMFYVSQYGDRAYLFGPDGVVPQDEFVRQVRDAGTFSLYTWSASPAWSEAVFYGGALIALAVTLGVGGRVGLALHWVFLWSVYQRQFAIIDGGDNLAYLVIPMLMLTRCYDRFSFSTGAAGLLVRRLPGGVRALSTPVHNLGVLAIATQICLVYMVSGLYKVQGDVWQDGTALFYILRIPEFTWPGVSDLVYDSDLLVYLGTYASVLFQVYFPLSILVPRLRAWAALASIGFHLSIGALMGLTSFALTMIACDLIFLSGGIDRALALARRTTDRITGKGMWEDRARADAERPRPIQLPEPAPRESEVTT
ncbi:HTTM domain-containing protein [Streptomyces sp. NPDC051219]|uniref:HTTM domain-containing protein n=1 Tax=Streptomyces sp. NPDC051219 TaxID=3155283 RepID=UPI00342CC6C8